MKKFTSQGIKKFVSKLHFDERVVLIKGLSWSKISIVTKTYNRVEYLVYYFLKRLFAKFPEVPPKNWTGV